MMDVDQGSRPIGDLCASRITFQCRFLSADVQLKHALKTQYTQRIMSRITKKIDEFKHYLNKNLKIHK